MRIRCGVAAGGVLAAATLAHGQVGGAYSLTWSTVDGGGQMFSTGGAYSLGGTIGQPDAGVESGGGYGCLGGFWGGGAASDCYANCDGSTAAPILNVNDFVCFQSRFAAGDSYANCDGSTTPPVLNINDFVCYQARFAAGCP